MQDNYIRSVIIEKIVDWDTLHISCDLGYDIWKKEKIRLARINCPEKNTDEWKKIKEYMQKYVWVEWVIQSLKYDKYGRGLAELYIDNKNISDELLSLWYAKQRDWKWVKPI